MSTRHALVHGSLLFLLNLSVAVWPSMVSPQVSAAAETSPTTAEKAAVAAPLDPQKLIGTWQYVSVEKGGEKREAAALADQKVTITPETFTLSGEGTFVMKYTLDIKSSPAKIKLTITESPLGTGVSTEGIIALEDDQLKLCYAAPEGKAPEKFTAATGTDFRLIVLKRAK